MATATNFKPLIISALETLRQSDLYKRQIFQAKAYAKAIESIQTIPGPIHGPEDVPKELPGVGAKIKAKIAEIIATGRLKAAESALEANPLEAIRLLEGVHGIGPVKAKELIETKGIRTIAQLRAAVSEDPTLLNEIQKMGLKYYEDSQQRIPREEMAEHESTLLTGLDPLFEGTIVGSYRRGALTSGDIDLLLTIGDEVPKKQQGELFLYMVKLFSDVEYIVDTLAEGPKKFMGYVRLEGKPARRLDMLITPKAEYPYAILYFTGSKEFNVAFRKYALEKGYTLNEHELKPIREGVPAVPLMRKEKDIFDFLGLHYVEPTLRRNEQDIRAK